ncbi:phosphoribosylamine--glycine ligase [Candidatus Acidulodesulfobacterium sp. H_13]|uniref:phosphoribosylamine--glycine ligase n=1 Tax=Candidatus Acidulodesulfobacterium sp. H_13 TaxID=3395470 RepID=UPI003AF488D1
MKILVIGSGGRESAIVYAIKKSKKVTEIYCAPGNGGTADTAKNVNIKQDNVEGLLSFALENKIDLTVVGPEVPLAMGIADEFDKAGLKIFGPNKKASLLESSKKYAKDFFKRNSIKTVDYASFTNFTDAADFVKQKSHPVVIKVDGLAAGKGVFISNGFEQSRDILGSVFNEKIFGESGETVIIEDFIDGFELSYMVITDGISYKPLITGMDYKKIYDGDTGENTGGMGAITPNPHISKTLTDKINETIIEPTLKGFKNEGIDYKGVLYAGIIIKNDEIYVLEFNVRFGDPETQAVLVRLKSDIIDLFMSVVNENLKDCELVFDDNKSICLVLSSEGYPKKYKTGYEISFDGINNISAKYKYEYHIFHAGTKKIDGKYYTNGGRVMNICVNGKTPEIVDIAYDIAKKINFENKYYRKDIGKIYARY